MKAATESGNEPGNQTEEVGGVGGERRRYPQKEKSKECSDHFRSCVSVIATDLLFSELTRNWSSDRNGADVELPLPLHSRQPSWGPIQTNTSNASSAYPTSSTPTGGVSIATNDSVATASPGEIVDDDDDADAPAPHSFTPSLLAFDRSLSVTGEIPG